MYGKTVEDKVHELAEKLAKDTDIDDIQGKLWAYTGDILKIVNEEERKKQTKHYIIPNIDYDHPDLDIHEFMALNGYKSPK